MPDWEFLDTEQSEFIDTADTEFLDSQTVDTIYGLYIAIRNGVADDAYIKAWCQSNYGWDHKVYAGIDDRKPPGKTDCPYVYLFYESKRAGYRLEQKEYNIGVITEIYKEGYTSVAGKANIITYTGMLHNELFRKLVEVAVISAIKGFFDGYAVDQCDSVYEDSEPYPYFRTYMGFSINRDYYQGSDVFT